MNGLGFAAVRDWNAWLRYDKRDDDGNRQPAGRRHQAHLHRDLLAAGPAAERLPPPRLQRGRERQEGVRRPHAVDRRGRRHQHELPLLADRAAPSATARTTSTSKACFPFANVRTIDPITGKTDSRYASCEKTNTCPLGVEIYSANEYWVKAASLLHTDPDGTARPARLTVRAQLLHLEHAARHRQRDNARAPASSSRTRSTRRRCSARCSSRWTNGRRNGTKPPKSRVPTFRRRHAGAAAAAVRDGLPEHSEPLRRHPGAVRHLHRAEDHALSLRLRRRASTRPASRRSTRR